MTGSPKAPLRALLGIGTLVTQVLLSHANNAAAATPATVASKAQLVHTREVFRFVANAAIDRVFPLFGADKERLWAPGWDPVFVWPAEATDRQGMVFQVAHGDRTAIWVNTSFDPVANTVQYVYVIPDVVVTVINLKLTPNAGSTDVIVSYERTALSVAANDLVSQMAASDRNAGPEWGQQINAFLKTPP